MRSSDIDEINAELQNHFERLLAAHDLAPMRHKGWVTVDGNFPALRASYKHAPDQNSVGQLFVQAMLDENSLVEECIAALGSNDFEALKDALLVFNVSMFHPILAACNIQVPEDQVTKEIWTSADGSVNAWAGNIGIRASDGNSISPPIDWIANLESALTHVELRSSFNWITAYFARMNDKEPMGSVTLNNENWPAGLAATLKSEWPITNGFYGCRLFVVVKAER